MIHSDPVRHTHEEEEEEEEEECDAQIYRMLEGNLHLFFHSSFFV